MLPCHCLLPILAPEHLRCLQRHQDCVRNDLRYALFPKGAQLEAIGEVSGGLLCWELFLEACHVKQRCHFVEEAYYTALRLLGEAHTMHRRLDPARQAIGAAARYLRDSVGEDHALCIPVYVVALEKSAAATLSLLGCLFALRLIHWVAFTADIPPSPLLLSLRPRLLQSRTLLPQQSRAKSTWNRRRRVARSRRKPSAWPTRLGRHHVAVRRCGSGKNELRNTSWRLTLPTSRKTLPKTELRNLKLLCSGRTAAYKLLCIVSFNVHPS